MDDDFLKDMSVVIPQVIILLTIGLGIIIVPAMLVMVPYQIIVWMVPGAEQWFTQWGGWVAATVAFIAAGILAWLIRKP